MNNLQGNYCFLKLFKSYLLFFVLIVIITVLYSFSNTDYAHAVIVDQVIAIVNKEPITLSDFAKFNEAAFVNYERMQDDALHGIFTNNDALIMSRVKKIVNILINKALVKQEEARAAIYISPKKINAYIETMARANNLTKPQFIHLLKQKGINFSSYKKNIETHFMEISLLRKIYRNRMNITRKELLDYYNKNIEEFKGRPEVDLKLIFITIPSNTSKALKEKIYKKALRIRRLAVKGNISFSELATKYSQDPSEKNGGRIGYVYKNKLSPNFSNVAFKLYVGQISKVIPSPFGYTILKSVGKKYGAARSFKEVKPELFSILERYKTNKFMAKLLKKARGKAYIKILI
jgi:parvulin-like peptidyl-prolyl isomerase